MKNPQLKIAKPRNARTSQVRQHFNNCVGKMFSEESPVIGYALVTFHKNKSYMTAHHISNAKIHQVDLPDMVKNRLQASVINPDKGSE